MSNSEEKKKLVAELQKEGVKVIASSHDFHKTDSQEVLLNRFREMEKSGADILKMAVMLMVSKTWQQLWRQQML